MVTNEVMQICNGVKSKVESIIRDAKKAFDERIKAMQDIEKMYREMPMMASLTNTTSSALISSAKVEMEKDRKKYTSELEASIKPITSKLESYKKTSFEVDDFRKLVETLEDLARLAAVLNYSSGAYSIEVKSCQGCLEDAARKWRETFTSDPTVRKKILEAELKTNKKELQELEEKLQKHLANLDQKQKELDETFANYEAMVVKAISVSTDKYRALMDEIAEAQQNVTLQAENKMTALDKFVHASIFTKFSCEQAYKAAKENFDKAIEKLQKLESNAKNFYSVVFVDQYRKAEREVDKLIKEIETIKNDIENCEIGITAHKNVIERIGGELNGK